MDRRLVIGDAMKLEEFSDGKLKLIPETSEEKQILFYLCVRKFKIKPVYDPTQFARGVDELSYTIVELF